MRASVRGILWGMLFVAGLLVPACGDDDGDSQAEAIEAICATYDRCLPEAEQMEDCQGFFEKVFSDLAARCTNVDEVSARYRESLQCVAAVECDEMGSAMCSSEQDAYEAAKTAGGATCEPDDD